MKPIILIKLGGSIITDRDKPYAANLANIRRLAKEIKHVKNPLVISHGSGSFGHISAKKFGGMKGYVSTIGFAQVARDAMEINRLVMDIFIEEKISALSLRPMSMILAKSAKIKKHTFEIIEEALKQNLIPVVYGDGILDSNWKSTIFSGEKLLSEITTYLYKKHYRIDKIIEVGETEGVYDTNKITIPKITQANWPKVKKFIHTNEHIDVTGGMQHKIEEALSMTMLGISTFIVNGKNPGELFDMLQGKSFNGTTITA